MIQCARLAFGYVGIFDPDEADAITQPAKDMGTAEIDLVDVEPMIADALKTTTDAEALTYWKENNGKLSKQPQDHKRLKEVISNHRAALKAKDDERTIDIPEAKEVPEYVPE
jgi:hypothetical protein